MAFSPEVMSADQRDMLRATGAFATQAGFCLAGGTSVAIQLGHRRSVDLGWFTPDPIVDPLALAVDLRKVLPLFTVTETSKGTLHGQAGGVKFSLLEYRYPFLSQPVKWSEYGCQLAGLKDLACMKLSAIGGRGARKDFVDVYALGRAGFTLSEMLDFYQRKFGIRDIAHVLMSLAYFDDAEKEEMPRMLWAVEWPEIRKTIEGWATEYVQRVSLEEPRGRADA